MLAGLHNFARSGAEGVCARGCTQASLVKLVRKIDLVASPHVQAQHHLPLKPGTNVAVVATVPLSEMFGYIGNLRAMSSGRASYTMDERFWRWACMGVIRQSGTARTVRFRVPYREIFDQLVLSAALAGRYKGSGEIIIPRKEGLTSWLTKQNQLLAKS